MADLSLNVKDAGGNTKALDYADDSGSGAPLTQKVNVKSLPSLIAGSALIGSVDHKSLNSIQRLPVSFNTIGNNEIIAAVAAQVIKILGLFLVFAGDVNIKFTDGSALDSTGLMSLVQNQQMSLPPVSEDFAWIVGASGRSFVINLSAGVQVSGFILYTQH